MTVRTNDLLGIATSGLRAQQGLLDTTGQNISNVNTEGYIRETTEYTSQLAGGVGRGVTSRVLDVFAQNQLRRDISSSSEADLFLEKMERLDNLLGSEANSLSSSMSRVFAALQTAVDEPSNVASRDLVLGEMETFLGQAQRLESFMSNTEKELNLELDSQVREANDLIKNVESLNQQIRDTRAANKFTEPGALLNERDKAINDLAKLVDIETRRLADDTIAVNLKSGQSLILAEGRFNLFQVNGDPDISQRTLSLSAANNPTTINVAETNLGGEIGAVFEFRDDVLAVSQRQLGQMTLAFTDAMNEQNKLGMDLDSQLGTNIFNVPNFTSINYKNNSDTSAYVEAEIVAGEAQQLTDKDYRITISNVAGNVVDFTVEVVDAKGNVVKDIAGNDQVLKDADGNDVAQPYSLDVTTGDFVEIGDGLQVRLPSGVGAYSAANEDQFLLRPSKGAVSDLTVDLVRGEDLAFASPINVEQGVDNLGSARIKSTSVTNTSVDTTGNQQSGFNSTGATFNIDIPGQAPGTGLGAPVEVVFNSANEFQLLDSAGNPITTVTGATNLNNIIEQARTSGVGPPGAWPYDATQEDYPGYDLSIQGVPAAGDRFTINYNANGVKDNRNGIDLSKVQDSNIIRGDASREFSDQNGASFHGAYSNTVSTVGEKTSSADINQRAANALFQQSQDNFEAVSGVSLDEEAANLVRFQQAYAASARLVSAAQTTFDAILSAVR